MRSRTLLHVPLCLSGLAATILITSLALRAPAAHASTGYGGALSISPPAGQAGTRVTISVSVQPPPQPPITDRLTVMTSPPPLTGCTGDQPVPGVASFQVVPVSTQNGGATITFAWPASLGPGMYWLCAHNVSGTHAPAYSQVPFAVVPSGATLAPVLLVASSLRAGGNVGVLLTSWPANDPHSPALYLLPQGQPDSAIVPLAGVTEVGHEVDSASSTETMYFDAVVPSSVVQGTYSIVAQNDYCVVTPCQPRLQSAPFIVISSAPAPAPTATAAPWPTAAPSPTLASAVTHPDAISRPAGPLLFTLVGLVLALLALGALGYGTWLLADRRRGAGKGRQAK